MDVRRNWSATVGMVAAVALTWPIDATAAPAWRFHLEEATIADVQRAIRIRQITATQLVSLYFKRIEAYNGTCVKGDIDPATGLMLGDIAPIENAGQVNAYMTLNIRGKRSKTDTADNDPKLLDALEVARAQDDYFARTGRHRPQHARWAILQSIRHQAHSWRIEFRLGRRDCGKPCDLRLGHRHRRVRAQSIIGECPGRHGGDAGAYQPRRHRAFVVFT